MSSSSAHDFFRNRIRQLRSPSKRTPDRETTLNNADNIERQLQEEQLPNLGLRDLPLHLRKRN
jgi:hypothetical protein